MPVECLSPDPAESFDGSGRRVSPHLSELIKCFPDSNSVSPEGFLFCMFLNKQCSAIEFVLAMW